MNYNYSTLEKPLLSLVPASWVCLILKFLSESKMRINTFFLSNPLLGPTAIAQNISQTDE